MSLEYHSQVSTPTTSVEIDAFKVDICKQLNTATSQLGNVASPGDGEHFTGPSLYSPLVVFSSGDHRYNITFDLQIL